jgi:hypothetical protein
VLSFGFIVASAAISSRRTAGSRSRLRCSSSGSERIRFQAGSTSKGRYDFSENMALIERVVPWPNMRPPAALTSSIVLVWVRQEAGSSPWRVEISPNMMGRL